MTTPTISTGLLTIYFRNPAAGVLELVIFRKGQQPEVLPVGQNRAWPMLHVLVGALSTWPNKAEE